MVDLQLNIYPFMSGDELFSVGGHIKAIQFDGEVVPTEDEILNGVYTLEGALNADGAEVKVLIPILVNDNRAVLYRAFMRASELAPSAEERLSQSALTCPSCGSMLLEYGTSPLDIGVTHICRRCRLGWVLWETDA